MRLRLRLRAIARQRCPVCFDGRMFAGPIRMHPTCPTCGHRFEREPGFFQGAMYVSYVLATLVLLVMGWLSYLVLAPRTGLAVALSLAVAVHLVAVPTLFRYSRVIWAHMMSFTIGPGRWNAPPGPGAGAGAG
jgi:uncharacterized protein (DUF983 family)